MKEVRKDYMKKLINGIRKQIENDPDTIEANERYKIEYEEGVIIPRWIDVTLLCDVIEKDILENDEIPSISHDEYLKK